MKVDTKNCRILGVLILALAVLFMGFTVEDTFAANTTINPGSGTIAPGLAQVNHGETLTLNPGNYIGNSQGNDGVRVDKNVTFQGNGPIGSVIVNGQNSDKLFRIMVNNINVTFINITFQNARFNPRGGGAVENEYVNSVMTFINCSFINNFVTGRSDTGGGAIYNNGANMHLENCIFINNTAGNIGGAIHNNGPNMTIVNCIFTNNFVGLSAAGGAIYTTNSNTAVINCTFNNNTAGRGGAIQCYGTGMYLENCTFKDNRAIGSDGVGGAILNGEHNMTLVNCIFINNSATPGATGQGANGAGGAIFNNGTNMYLENCTFTNNTARYGGTIYNRNNNMTIINSTFTNNNATDSGGAIYNNNDVNIIIANSTFNNNRATTFGGAIFNSNGTNMSVANSSFNNNIGIDGGAIYNINSVNMSITNSTFNNNRATTSGGAIYNINSINMRIANSTFTNNTGVNGGAIHNSNGANMSIANSTFNNNRATTSGGAIYNINSVNMSIANSTFTNNTGVNGGAIHNSNGANMSIANSTFNNNNATTSGGAIYNTGMNVTVNNNNFTNNTATYGGGIFNTGSSSSIIVNGSIFINNTQAIGLGNTNYQLNNNTITNNTIGIQFALNGQTYVIPNLIGPSSVVNVANIIADNTYAIGFSGNNSIYTLADSSYNATHRNGVVFTGMGIGSTNSGVSSGNRLVNSNIIGYSGVGATFDRGSQNNNISNCNISNNTIGVAFNGANNILMSTNFINNLLGINVTNNATASVINYNRIYNNTDFGLSNQGTSTNANFNWWGKNDITGLFINTGSLTLNQWFAMELATDTFKTVVNGSTARRGVVNLTYQLVLLTNGSTPNTSYSDDVSRLPDFLIDITWRNNTGIVYTLYSVNAKGNYSYNVIVLPANPTASIRAIGDNENIILNITLMPDYSYGLFVNSSASHNPGDGSTWAEAVNNISAALEIIIYYNLTNCVIHVAGSSATGGGADDYRGSGINTNLTLNSTFNNLTIMGGGEDSEGVIGYGTPNIFGESTYVFNITGNNIKLINLAFINGTTSAIYNTGNNTSVTNCVFENNRASNGGAIYNTGVNFSVISSNFVNNTASSSGGAIYNTAVGFFVNSSNFINNIAEGAGDIDGGGAIFNDAEGSSVINSNFTNNTAYAGGAIYNYYTADLVVTSSDFINNTASNTGGAIFNRGPNMIITSSNFTNNSGGAAVFNGGSNMTVTSSNFTNNSGGGAINNGGPNMNITNSNFINNSVASIGGSGGAIQNSGNNVYVANSNFTNNSAANGGAIRNSGNNMIITSSNFINNTGTNNGGVIFNSGSGMSITNSNFTNNTALAGVAIYNSGSNVNITNSNFNHNNATNVGGAIFNQGANFNVVNSTFNNNTARTEGGAIYNGRIGSIIITNSDFDYNTANSGGAIYNLGSINITSSDFNYNTARNSHGGAIYNLGNNVNVSNSNFTNNSATISGGAIYNNGTDFTVTMSNFTNNSAVLGGGIFNTEIGSITVNDSVFTNNTQAIGLGNTDYVLNNNTIRNNTIAIQFALNNQSYIVPNLINNWDLNNIIAGNVYVIGISGNNTIYSLAPSNYTSNTNGVIFTGIGSNSTNSGVANRNTLRDSNIIGYSNGAGVTFDIGSTNNIVNNMNIFNNNIGVVLNGNNNTLNNSNISNNNIGVLLNSGTNNRLESTNIINNGFGINVLNDASGSIINYNRINNNTGLALSNQGTSTNANFNWWGQNDIAGLTANNGSITLDQWFAMELVFNTFKTVVNATTATKNSPVDLTYQLVLLTNGTSPSTAYNADVNRLPFFTVNVTWRDKSGVVYTLLPNSDARGNYSFNTPVNPTANIRAIGDNEDVTLKIIDYSIYGLFVNSSALHNPGDGSSWAQAVNNISAALQIIIDNNLTNCVIHVAGSSATGGGADDYRGSGINTNLTLNSTFNNLTIMGGGEDSEGIIGYGTPNIFGESTYVFNITGNNIKLINLAFMNGTTSAIRNTGENTSVTDCIFENNRASNGGAIYNTGVNMIVSDSTFYNNTATTYGGAIYNTGASISLVNSTFDTNYAGSGGAIYNTGVNMFVDNCTFDNNFANGIGSFNTGGAIHNNGGVNINLVNSTFYNNTATNGGAIYNFAATNMSIINCTFTSNTAATGGAIFNSGAGNTSVIDSTFNNNAANRMPGDGGAIHITGTLSTNFMIDNCSFNHNTATNGGAIRSSGVNVNVVNSTFYNNTATNGGAIYSNGNDMSVATNCNFINNTASYGGAIYTAGVDMVVANSTFINNTAVNNGGAVFNNAANMSIGDSTFNNNIASYGGAIWNSGLNMNIIDSAFNNNIARSHGGTIWNGGFNMSVDDSSFNNNSAYVGGAIYNSYGDNLSVTNCIFSSNIAGSSGGAIFNENGTNLIVANSIFNNNSAIGSGGAICSYTGDNFSIVNCTFNNNTADSSGGAIFNTGANITVNNSSFDGNTATTSGGAIFNTGPNMSVLNCNFTNNTANEGGAIINYFGNNFSVVDCDFINNTANSGGAIYNYGILNLFGVNMSIFDCNFINNTANSGGAIYNYDGINMSVINSTFDNNSATNYGGAIYNTATNMEVTNSSFNYNTGVNGGAIYNTGIDMSIANSTFDNNNARNGGVIYNNAANMSVNNSSFNYNTANEGGVIYANEGGVIYNTGINMMIANSNFTNNSATNSRYGGGVIYNTGINMMITNSNFINNSRTGSGGANGGGVIYNTGNNMIVSNSNFINNSANISGASSGGGAIYNIGANLNITNSSFINNSANISGASSGGGAIYNSGVNLSITNSSFINNSVDGSGAISGGGAIYNNRANMTVTNSIFINNSANISGASSGGGAILNDAGDNTIIANCTFDNNISNYPGAIYNSGANTTVINCTFNNNNASSGGAIHNEGYNVSVINCTFNNNNASSGGAIYNAANSFSVVNSTFKNNIAIMGGGIYNRGNIVVNGSTFTDNSQAIGLGNIDYQLNNNTIKDNLIAIQFVLYNQVYTIPDLIGPSNVVNVANVIANNTYAIGISGSSSTYTLASSSYNSSGNKNGVIFTGIGTGSTNSGAANGNSLVNSNIRGYSGVGVTFDRGAGNNNVSDCNISNNDVGVVFNGRGALMSSNIIDNNLGINVTLGTSNAVINYNRIYNNTNFGLSNYGTSTNANFNWWGQNVINTQYDNQGTGLNLIYWYVLQLSLNTTINNTANTTRNYPKDQYATLSYELTLNNEFGNFILHNKNLLPYFTVNIQLNNSTSVVLTFNQDSKLSYLNNSFILTHFDPSAQIRALADNEDIYLRLVNDTPFVNLTVTKIANVNNVLNGQLVTYYITVYNNGPYNATNISVTDILDSRFVFDSFSVTEGNYYNGVWNIDSLDAGVGATLTIVVKIDGTGNITNYVYVTVDQDNIGDFSDNETIYSYPTVNLTITKTVNTTNALNGQNLTYIITVYNHGPDIATNVNVTETLDNRLILLENTTSQGNYIGNIWNIGTIGINNSVTMTLIVRINGINDIYNNVTLDSVDQNSTGYNSSNTVVTVVDPAVNLTISKSVNATTVNNGDSIAYTISVTNHGPNDATNVVVNDILDSRLVFVGSYPGVYYESATHTVTWTIGNLPVGTSVNLTFIVDTRGTGVVSNVATVTVNESNVGNNSSNNVEVGVRPYVNLTIVKSVDRGSALNGENLTYVITVTNHGPDDATGLVILEELDSRLIVLSNSTGGYGNWNGTHWILGNLANSNTATLTIAVKINGAGNIYNNVTLEGLDQNSTGDNTSNTVVTVVDPAVNLTITKSVNTTNALNGQNLTYVITVFNHGPDIATNVNITEVLDSRLILLQNTTSQGNYNGNIWNIGTITVNDSVTMTLIVRINGTGIITNNVTVTADQNIASNNTASNNTTADSAVNLTITKTASVSEVVNGQTITYTIIVTNYGPDDATGVVVTEILDSRLILLSNSTTQGTYDGTLWIVGDLANGNSVTLNLVVRVNGTGVIYNNVTASSTRRNVGDENASIVILSVHNTSINLVSNFSSDGKVLFMTARLVDELGNPLSGRTIDFYVQYISITDENGVPIFASKYAGSAITDSNGVTQLNYTSVSRFDSGNYLVTASFNGDTGYPSSFDTDNPHLSDDTPSDDPVPPNDDPKNKNKKDKNNSVTGAEMKNTGIDLTAILLVLISLFGAIIMRKQK